jgi:hypothetical protein
MEVLSVNNGNGMASHKEPGLIVPLRSRAPGSTHCHYIKNAGGGVHAAGAQAIFVSGTWVEGLLIDEAGTGLWWLHHAWCLQFCWISQVII